MHRILRYLISKLRIIDLISSAPLEFHGYRRGALSNVNSWSPYSSNSWGKKSNSLYVDHFLVHHKAAFWKSTGRSRYVLRSAALRSVGEKDKPIAWTDLFLSLSPSLPGVSVVPASNPLSNPSAAFFAWIPPSIAWVTAPRQSGDGEIPPPPPPPATKKKKPSFSLL